MPGAAPHPSADESDKEDFQEPEAKRRRRAQSEISESEIADIFLDSDEEDEIKVVNALILCGVDEGTARKKARDIVSPDEAT
jgi:hypothetical protein